VFDFFHFGKQDELSDVPDLSPADAGWASARLRTDRKVASALGIGQETASHVLLRLDRDGLLELHKGPAVDGEPTSGPTDWACRVLSLVFPALQVRRDSSELTASATSTAPAAPDQPSTTSAAKVDPLIQEHRAISELEAEIKKMERQRHRPAGLDIVGGDAEWLRTMKRRLRSVDPNNPWARDDWG
jgi:DNA-binding transcriptional MocR family regulator